VRTLWGTQDVSFDVSSLVSCYPVYFTGFWLEMQLSHCLIFCFSVAKMIFFPQYKAGIPILSALLDIFRRFMLL
jgi:hypothetical protein